MGEALLRRGKPASSEENADVAHWEREYLDLQVIPSSTRQRPSRALTLFSELVNYEKVRDVLEPGCGIGRNAIYLALKGCWVTAIDFSAAALAKTVEAARSLHVENRILPCLADLSNTFPLTDHRFDLSVDSYVFCHFTDDDMRHHYCSEISRVTKPRGLVYSAVFAHDDEYYKHVADGSDQSDGIVTDPNNGITKRLYAEAEIKYFLGQYFSLRYFVKFQFPDVVLGQVFRRSLFVTLLENRSFKE